MAIFGTLATVRRQAAHLPHFQTALAYLDECFQPGSAAHARLMALAAGKSHKAELADGVFAIEQVYESRARAESFFESHRKYVDVQAVVAGAELMEVADRAQPPVRQPYDAERDVIIYGDFAGGSVLRVAAGEAAVFFPEDAHMPSLRDGAPALVRKTVLKIPAPA